MKITPAEMGFDNVAIADAASLDGNLIDTRYISAILLQILGDTDFTWTVRVTRYIDGQPFQQQDYPVSDYTPIVINDLIAEQVKVRVTNTMGDVQNFTGSGLAVMNAEGVFRLVRAAQTGTDSYD